MYVHIFNLSITADARDCQMPVIFFPQLHHRGQIYAKYSHVECSAVVSGCTKRKQCILGLVNIHIHHWTSVIYQSCKKPNQMRFSVWNIEVKYSALLLSHFPSVLPCLEHITCKSVFWKGSSRLKWWLVCGFNAVILSITLINKKECWLQEWKLARNFQD